MNRFIYEQHDNYLSDFFPQGHENGDFNVRSLGAENEKLHKLSGLFFSISKNEAIIIDIFNMGLACVHFSHPIWEYWNPISNQPKTLVIDRANRYMKVDAMIVALDKPGS